MKVTTGITAPGPASLDRARMARRFGSSTGPDLTRGSQVPDSRSVHLNDAQAELHHGRVGRAEADREETDSTVVWVAFCMGFVMGAAVTVLGMGW